MTEGWRRGRRCWRKTACPGRPPVCGGTGSAARMCKGPGNWVCGAFPAGALRPGMSRQSQLFPYQTCPPPEMSGADSARAGRILHAPLPFSGRGGGRTAFSGGDRGRRGETPEAVAWVSFCGRGGPVQSGCRGRRFPGFRGGRAGDGDGAGRDGSGPKDKALCLGRGRGSAAWRIPGRRPRRARRQQEEQLARVRRQQEEQLAQVRRQYEEQLAQVRRQQEEQLARAGRQYEELARVTRQLQEAGRKWREMHFEEI